MATSVIHVTVRKPLRRGNAALLKLPPLSSGNGSRTELVLCIIFFFWTQSKILPGISARFRLHSKQVLTIATHYFCQLSCDPCSSSTKLSLSLLFMYKSLRLLFYFIFPCILTALISPPTISLDVVT